MIKEYFLGITQGNKVLRTETLNDFLIRNDISHVFSASYCKRTPKNNFYKIAYQKNDIDQEVPVEIYIKGIKSRYIGGEIWVEFLKSSKGKCIQFEITDLLGFEKKLNFHNYPNETSGLEGFLNYLDDLTRLGTHQAIKELTELEYSMKKLQKRLKLKV